MVNTPGDTGLEVRGASHKHRCGRARRLGKVFAAFRRLVVRSYVLRSVHCAVCPLQSVCYSTSCAVYLYNVQFVLSGTQSTAVLMFKGGY